MTSRQAYGHGPHFWLSVTTVVSIATFSVGYATLASMPGTADGGQSGSKPAVLDMSRPYLTIQHGVIVPGRTPSPALDTSRPYLTIQHGVIVPGQ